MLQVLSLCLAAAGVGVAFAMLDGAFVVHEHSVLGLVVLGLVAFQATNGACRPHKSNGGEPKTALRWAWERLHQATGLLIAVLAMTNCILGGDKLHTVWGAPAAAKTVAIAAAAIWAALYLFVLIFGGCRRPKLDVETTTKFKPEA